MIATVRGNHLEDDNFFHFSEKGNFLVGQKFGKVLTIQGANSFKSNLQFLIDTLRLT